MVQGFKLLVLTSGEFGSDQKRQPCCLLTVGSCGSSIRTFPISSNFTASLFPYCLQKQSNMGGNPILLQDLQPIRHFFRPWSSRETPKNGAPILPFWCSPPRCRGTWHTLSWGLLCLGADSSRSESTQFIAMNQASSRRGAALVQFLLVIAGTRMPWAMQVISARSADAGSRQARTTE